MEPNQNLRPPFPAGRDPGLRRPRWLADAHDALDRAVANAYGWPEDISTEDALQRLLALNLERAAAQGKVVGRVAEDGPSSPLPAPSRGEAG